MTLLLIALGILATIFIASYLIVKWHDRVKENTIKRAVEGGCPFFINNNK